MDKIKKQELKDKAVKLVEDNNLGIRPLSRALGITHTTIQLWMKDDDDFRQRINLARKTFVDNLVPEANKSLKKLVCGYTRKKVVERKYPSGAAKEVIITTEEIAPSMDAIKYINEVSDPENYD